jgi:hypothetical protein
MKKPLLCIAVSVLYAAPGFAQCNKVDLACGDIGSTGSSPAFPPELSGRRVNSNRMRITPPEESWQEMAQEDAEERRRQEVDGCRPTSSSP